MIGQSPQFNRQAVGRKEDSLNGKPPQLAEVQLRFLVNQRRIVRVHCPRSQQDEVQPAAPNLALNPLWNGLAALDRTFVQKDEIMPLQAALSACA